MKTSILLALAALPIVGAPLVPAQEDPEPAQVASVLKYRQTIPASIHDTSSADAPTRTSAELALHHQRRAEVMSHVEAFARRLVPGATMFQRFTFQTPEWVYDGAHDRFHINVRVCRRQPGGAGDVKCIEGVYHVDRDGGHPVFENVREVSGQKSIPRNHSHAALAPLALR